MTQPNYTPEMVEVIRNWPQPLNQAAAVAIADQIGRNSRSVIAKIKSLGLTYEIKRPARKRGASSSTKQDTINAIAKGLDMDADDLIGLEKATARALTALLREIP